METHISSPQKNHILPSGLYGIITQSMSLGRSVLSTAKVLLDHGVKVIQYREKHGEKESGLLLDECLILRELTKQYQAKLIVNDYPCLAMMSGADGIHLGQDDFSVSAVRALVGSKMIIGISTHTVEQAEQAWADGADYIGFGPLFPTFTKPTYEAIGFAQVPYILAKSPVPVVGIGGIKQHNLDKVLDQGFKHVCLVSEITAAQNPTNVLQSLQQIINNHLSRDYIKNNRF
jgi:thiamine-phosphate pyrophosphorylase